MNALIRGSQRVSLSTIFTGIRRGQAGTEGLRVGLSICGDCYPTVWLWTWTGRRYCSASTRNEHEIYLAFQIAKAGRVDIGIRDLPETTGRLVPLAASVPVGLVPNPFEKKASGQGSTTACRRPQGLLLGRCWRL